MVNFFNTDEGKKSLFANLKHQNTPIMPKQPPTPEEYYGPVLRDKGAMDNKNARAIYFEETEPKDGLPTHNRVLHVEKAKIIARMMMVRLMRDLIVNGRHAWKHGTPIPHPETKFPGTDEPRQPLAEGSAQLIV